MAQPGNEERDPKAPVRGATFVMTGSLRIRGATHPYLKEPEWKFTVMPACRRMAGR